MRLLAIAIAVVGWGCAAPRVGWPQRSTGDRGDAPFVTLERTECLGTCPVYGVAVYRDGTVEYEGRAHVKVVGRKSGLVTPEQVAEIERVFAEGDYFRFADRYVHIDETDQPAVLTSYAAEGRRKRIDHYLGDQSAPPELEVIERRLDLVVGVAQWVGEGDP